MNKEFVIEETIENSIGRDEQGNPINETLFTVVSWQGRNFLYKGKFSEDTWQESIAECLNGDYRKRYDGIHGWLKFILKRTDKRLCKITDQLNELHEEANNLTELKYDIQEVGIKL